VRVIGVPDLGTMPKEAREESAPVFEYLVGKYKRIASFNQFGLAEFQVSINATHLRGWHIVAIEPRLLSLPRQRGAQ
jgi:hypothetical protein